MRQEVAAEASNTPVNNIRMELFNLLNSASEEKEDPCHRLSDRVSFLNRLIHHKTTTNISWTRLVNLVSGISSQAAVVLFRDEQSREETIPEWASPTTSPKLVKDTNMG